jgi:hypothetical protein
MKDCAFLSYSYHDASKKYQIQTETSNVGTAFHRPYAEPVSSYHPWPSSPKWTMNDYGYCDRFFDYRYYRSYCTDCSGYYCHCSGSDCAKKIEKVGDSSCHVPS